MSAAGPPVLWHIEISHFNEKARWALDWKGVEHVRKAPQPGLHSLHARRLTGGSTFPVLEIGGQAIADSTRIIAELEAAFPEPPLYPDEPLERERALEIEDFFDEQVAPDVRRLVFFHLLRSPDVAQALADSIHAGPLKARALRLALPLIRREAAGRYGVGEAATAQALDRIRAGVARVEAEAGPSGYLVGDRFSVADLAAAALLSPLVRPPELPYPLPGYPPALEQIRASLGGPAFDWVRDIYARHRPASVALSG